MSRRLTLVLPDAGALERLARAPRPLGLSAAKPVYRLVRETYFDTADGDLAEARLSLKLVVEARGRSRLELTRLEAVNLQGVMEEQRWSSPVVGGGLYATLAGDGEVATRIRGLVDPAALRPVAALDIDRERWPLRSRWTRRPEAVLLLDHVVAQAPGASAVCHLATLEEVEGGRTPLEELGERLRRGFGATYDGRSAVDRIRDLLQPPAAPEAPEGSAVSLRTVVLFLQGGAVALGTNGDRLELPAADEGGEEGARGLVRRLLGPGGAREELDLELVGFAPADEGRSNLEVWLHQEPLGAARPEPDLLWIPLGELLERVGAPGLRSPELVAALLLLVRSEVGLRLLREGPAERAAPVRLPAPARGREKVRGEKGRRGEAGAAVRGEGTGEAAPEPGEAEEDFLSKELSILDFNVRVLEMAEDPSVPLLERFFYLSVFASNLDEFFVVRVARLKAGGDRRTLDMVAVRVRALLRREYHCLSRLLLPELARRGVEVRRWNALDEGQRTELHRRFQEEIFPLLTPHALSAGPGQPFPRLRSLGLSLAAVLAPEDGGEAVHLAHVPIPPELPRFLPVPGTAHLIPVEEVVLAHAEALFPGLELVGAHAFRVSRAADVAIDGDRAESLLDTVADEVEARAYKPVVRLEVQRTMPREVRAHLLRELRAEPGAAKQILTRDDVYEADGPLDLRALAALRDHDPLVEPATLWPPAPEPADPFAGERSVFEVMDRGDRLVFHPYDDFGATVGRFLEEAAVDPHVVSIRMTLYRTGRSSPVVETLLRALDHGKDVTVFVELTARFDEESNIDWTHRLRAAGAHVVVGIPGYKTHAKTALVVRRSNGRVRRYVHVGTGNYNAATAAFYTDLGLLSSDEALGADLNDFFNELTAGVGPPSKPYRKLLIAPSRLLDTLLDHIDTEAERARAGEPARIRAKLNGLSDRTVIRALYRAARAGVEVDLTVRSICTLRPGVPGLSEGIRVRSVLGRFLEHARIYYFENGGQGAYYIGSADWRPRNLRRRVEVVAPVTDPDARSLLRRILDEEARDPRAWTLRPDGAYERMEGQGPTAQEAFLSGWRREA